MLEKFNSYTPDIVRRNMKAVRSLRLNKDIRILQADKGNCSVMLDESKYKDKLTTLLEPVVYKPWSKDHTDTVARKVQKLLFKHKPAPPTDLEHKLTPYHSKPSHIHGLSEIPKPNIPLRPIVSSIGSPC
jgi:hypothetical protein